MLGFGDKGHVDPTKLPILVHAIRSSDAFAAAQKVWSTNARNLRVDAANHKELLRFVFNQPACVVWLQRDQGRTDAFELILLWDGQKEDVTEVYVIEAASGAVIGDDKRAISLLNAILASPATVPVNQSA
ncbi:MAG TPA: hypothetical protein VD735_00570 [Candidatus Saccharimonadales bacterium]|nr:hypothetical protein [Candidatus Saccharimonadales bacterium]